MSSQSNTSTRAVAASTLAVSVEVVTTDKNKQVVNVQCGSCGEVNCASVPKKVFHVVVAGEGGVGIFNSSVHADAFVLGVPAAVRSKADSWEEAISAMKTALAGNKCRIIEGTAEDE